MKHTPTPSASDDHEGEVLSTGIPTTASIRQYYKGHGCDRRPCVRCCVISLVNNCDNCDNCDNFDNCVNCDNCDNFDNCVNCDHSCMFGA